LTLRLWRGALAKAQADYLAGKTVVSASVPGIAVHNQLDITITERIRLILVALNKLAPSLYPADQISQSSITRVVFNG
jgi:hypothetical protein